ncbi:MAG: cyclic nucleotide-binding domain-containing protein, partial [Acidobacteriota bacterium]|nr:cyclic nucleotide-binding domain-containing protein [Acidobacteriota bacterium]
LEDHLRTVPLFSSLSAEFIDRLSQTVELVRYSRGEILCREGDEAQNFFLVRIGFVKMAEEHPGGELVLAYQGKGGFFGEIGLINRGTYAFTVTALDNVEVVRIGATEFREMLAQFPEIAHKLKTAADGREEHNKRHSSAVAAVTLDSFLKQGLMESNSLLVIDLERCTRCDNCVKACSEAHDGFTRLVREGLRFDKYLIPTSCRHCRDPLCMVGCPVGSIRRRNSMETVIEDWCVGCGLCSRNCPYGNITMMELENKTQAAVKKRRATACDLCSDLPEPSCVYACPHDAAHRVEPNTFFRDLISAAADENMFITPADVEGGRQ